MIDPNDEDFVEAVNWLYSFACLDEETERLVDYCYGVEKDNGGSDDARN